MGLAGNSSILSNVSFAAGMPVAATAADFNKFSASNGPHSAGRERMVASTFTPSLADRSLFDTAVSNVRWMARFARPLAAQALRTMISTAGSAALLAEALVASGRPAALAIYELAVAFGEADLVAALAVPLGTAVVFLGVTASPAGEGSTLPPALRKRSPPANPPEQRKKQQGSPQLDVRPKPAQTARPLAPSAEQVRQSQASMAAANSLAQANAATPSTYAAVEKFYRLASGGRAALASGSLTTAMHAVEQSRQALSDAIVQSDKHIAASLPTNRAALKEWHGRLVEAKTSIDTWLAAAKAFCVGLGSTARAPLPRPPTSVVDAPSSPRSSAQVARQLSAAYESARSATRGAEVVTTATTPRTAAAKRTDDVKHAAAAQSQTGRALPTRADPVTARMNAGVVAFYQQAGGGKAARQSGRLTEELRAVTESKTELGEMIRASYESISPSGPADDPALDRWRTKLRAAHDAVDAWLPKANAFAAGLNGAGGKPVEMPTLPAIPSATIGTRGEDGKAAAGAMTKARDTSRTALASDSSSRKTAAQTKPTGPSDIGAAGIPNSAVTVLARSGNVRITAGGAAPKDATDIWLNPDEGKISRTPKSGPGWIKAAMAVDGGESPPGEPPPGRTIHLPNGSADIDGVKLSWGSPDPKGPKGRDPKDPVDLLKWSIVAGVALSTVSMGLGEFHRWEDAQQKRLDGLEAANSADTKLFDIKPPKSYRNAGEKADAFYKTWVSYLDQGERLLTNSRVGDQEAPGDGKYLAAYRTEKEKFIKQLAEKREAIKSSKDINTANALLADCISNPSLRFNPANFEASDLATYKGRETRPQVCLAAIVKAINDKVIASLTGLDKREITDPIGSTKVNKLGGALAGDKPESSVPALPPITAVTPPVAATPAPARPGGGRATDLKSPPWIAAPATPTTSATEADPTAILRAETRAVAGAKAARAARDAALVKADQQAAVTGIGQAFDSPEVALKRPGNLNNLKFDSGMFLSPADRQRPDAIRNAFIRVEALVKKLDAVRLRLHDEKTQAKLYAGLESLAALAKELKALHDEVSARERRGVTPPVATPSVDVPSARPRLVRPQPEPRATPPVDLPAAEPLGSPANELVPIPPDTGGDDPSQTGKPGSTTRTDR